MVKEELKINMDLEEKKEDIVVVKDIKADIVEEESVERSKT